MTAIDTALQNITSSIGVSIPTMQSVFLGLLGNSPAAGLAYDQVSKLYDNAGRVLTKTINFKNQRDKLLEDKLDDQEEVISDAAQAITDSQELTRESQKEIADTLKEISSKVDRLSGVKDGRQLTLSDSPLEDEFQGLVDINGRRLRLEQEQAERADDALLQDVEDKREEEAKRKKGENIPKPAKEKNRIMEIINLVTGALTAGVGGLAVGVGGLLSTVIGPVALIFKPILTLMRRFPIVTAFTAAVAALSGIYEAFQSPAAKAAIENVKHFIENILGTDLGTALVNVKDVLFDIFGYIDDVVISLLKKSSEGWKLLTVAIFDTINLISEGKLMDSIKATLNGIWLSIKDGASSVIKGFHNIVKATMKKINDLTGFEVFPGVNSRPSSLYNASTIKESNPEVLRKRAKHFFTKAQEAGRSGDFETQRRFNEAGKAHVEKYKMVSPQTGGRARSTIGGMVKEPSNISTKEAQAALINELNNVGITDPKEIANILAQVQAESNFQPKSENLNYSPARAAEVFDSHFSSVADARNVISKGPEAFANRVYGGRMGNDANEGFKYRGRGFIQLTGKNNYEKYGKRIGVDLVNNPDLALEPTIAARITAEYMKDARNKGTNLKDVRGVGKAVGFVPRGEEFAKRKRFAKRLLPQITEMAKVSPIPSMRGTELTQTIREKDQIDVASLKRSMQPAAATNVNNLVGGDNKASYGNAVNMGNTVNARSSDSIAFERALNENQGLSPIS